MKLNRNNYEEYFILYMDNELSSDERREVEVFLQENPDLKAELDTLLQSKLTPDIDIHFTDKGSLMRFGSASVNMENYEAWLISYIDNELDNDEKAEVEKFLAANPSVQKELALVQRTKLQPDAIVFPNKESLYRKEEKAKVIILTWRRIAVAAAFLIAISTTGIVLLKSNKQGGDQGSVAKINSKKDSITPAPKENIAKNQDNTQPAEGINNSDEKKEQQADNRPLAKKNAPDMIAKNNPVVDKKEDKTIVITKSQQPEQANQEDKLIAYDKSSKSANNPNNLTEPTKENKNVYGDAVSDESKTSNQPGIDAGLTKNQPKTSTDPVTPETANPYNTTKATGSSDNNNKGASFASQSNNTQKEKGGIRGFLRKLTRTFEKRTNIKATDDDDRLLIAGLSIKVN